MSSDLYFLRLYWDGRVGCAKAPGVFRRFTALPALPGLPMMEFLDFAPDMHTALLRTCGSKHEREMTADEQKAASHYLRDLCPKKLRRRRL